ncbi:MAG: hypothetical protein ABIR96_10495 [Bdellovibrionota bacterium]
MWSYLLLWFVMPFTAFMALEKLFSDDEDPRDMDDDPELGKTPAAIDTTPELEPTLNTAPLDKE